ncbi:beta-galactosidase GanA [Paenibacillus phyllosphaerae]|uniref:Beta-galactosidase GanA n=1 Tax=Paenibacillus phyllosphaerae TaxID=274593 RepID=A0A7W5FP26_9BACL|nr:beta-galactosidase GanA [Paenibacillus phyllosphaerae]
MEAPLAMWGNLFEAVEAKGIGHVRGGLTPGLAFLTERSYGKGAIVMLGAMPAGDEGELLLRHVVDHYAEAAGVTMRTDVSEGTIVAPRRYGNDLLWVIVNMNGRGGTVTLPTTGNDLLTGARLDRGPISVEPFGYRVIQLLSVQQYVRRVLR